MSAGIDSDPRFGILFYWDLIYSVTLTLTLVLSILGSLDIDWDHRVRSSELFFIIFDHLVYAEERIYTEIHFEERVYNKGY